ncbi:uncharacterized protein B0I36DRAFT_354020 [Microdochium trichocladiopsis]|uniref:Glycosyltransferase family 25 protein n=1 Tax=Microdochium trichocladiopsis TaxID=1682393 RepID=A0A9P8XZF1_9PEZI|nr:uncharacterized protein B0I36DRAFT_354020 [Microdochium trichocladiopsis]KAH7021354.1 hypothetical protein B0I36DRAFT_354020 [Microdochium trichocladiopsis]
MFLTLIATLLALTMLAVMRGSYTESPSALLASLGFATAASHTIATPSSPREAAANTTLGFAQLLALSAGPSWRTRGLAAAADLVGLDITIPSQPPITDEAIANFQAVAKSRNQKGPEYGSAKAWLAHLDLLRYVVASGWETAFILEDDVDFDIAIRDQMQLISDNVRTYTTTPGDNTAPYGSGWDVLWVGHCGSWIFKEVLPDMHLFADATRIPTPAYAGWSKRFLREFLAEGTRAVHHNHMSVCTFGYGVSARGAHRLIELASADNGAEAFDVSLSNHCRDAKVDCLMVNPQVFNHYQPPAELGYVSQVHSGDGKGTPVDESEFEHVMGSTANIVNSARCQALFGESCVAPPREM